MDDGSGGRGGQARRLRNGHAAEAAPLEERAYRMRCVEGWSMVIPWAGFSFSEFVRRVAPAGNAKYVEFVALYDPRQMPGQRSRVLEWSYAEGLRLDEAVHPLTAWMRAAPQECGFYSNVNPHVDHPRWSQARSAASENSSSATR